MDVEGAEQAALRGEEETIPDLHDYFNGYRRTLSSEESLITSSSCYNVTTEEKDLDLAFLVTFAIARTDQVFYS